MNLAGIKVLSKLVCTLFNVQRVKYTSWWSHSFASAYPSAIWKTRWATCEH